MAIDPIGVDGIVPALEHAGGVEQVVLTNRHHLRGSEEIVAAFGAALRCPRVGLHDFEGPDAPAAIGYGWDEEIAEGVIAHEVGSLSPDEGALHIAVGPGALAFADTVVADDGGLGFVPDSLMDDPEETKRRDPRRAPRRCSTSTSTSCCWRTGRRCRPAASRLCAAFADVAADGIDRLTTVPGGRSRDYPDPRMPGSRQMPRQGWRDRGDGAHACGPGVVLVPAAADAASPFRGNASWVWYVSASGGSAEAMARKADRRGLDAVYVKSGDAGNYWSQFDSGARPLRPRARPRRLRLAVRLRQRSEAARRRSAPPRSPRGADCLIIDAESRLRGSLRGR